MYISSLTPASHLIDKEIKIAGGEWAGPKPLSREVGRAGGVLPGCTRGDRITLCYEFGGQAAAVRGLPVPEDPLLPQPLSCHSAQQADYHLVMNSFRNTKDIHLVPKLGTHSPCPGGPSPAPALSLGLVFHRGMVCGHLSAQAAHAMDPYPTPSPPSSCSSSEHAVRGVKGEHDLAGSQSLTTHLSLLSHSAFRPFTCLPCGWAEMSPLLPLRKTQP